MFNFAKFLLSIIAILVGCWFAAKGNVVLFIDSVSILLVFIIYAIAGSKELINRFRAFGDGALAGAWLGALLGLVQILSKGELFWNNPADPDLDIYKALAIVSLCLFWGYLFKFLSFLIAENWPFDS